VCPPIATRRATPGDLDAVIAAVQAGFDSYVAFAPRGWRPPAVADERDRTAELLSATDTWGLLALVDQRPVGHVAFMPAREHAAGEPRAGEPRERWRSRSPIPGVAHLWQLFVLPQWWGSGVAALLHDRALAEMRARGYEGARLFTPSLHARARRFYERRRWHALDEQWFAELGLTCVEYRLNLDPTGGGDQASDAGQISR
jgi:GNAT superfamily N-acetyltransferase